MLSWDVNKTDLSLENELDLHVSNDAYKDSKVVDIV